MEWEPAAGFARALASRDAVPGGGAASAVAGALGAALGSMVGELTAGKKKYAPVEKDLRLLMAQAESLREELLALAVEDGEAFMPLSRAYSLSRDDPAREETMEACLRRAAAVPLKILEKSGQALALLEEFARKGSALAVSDAGTGAALCRAALWGAALNVRANTRLMADRDRARELDLQTEGLLREHLPLAERICEEIYGRTE